MLLLGAAPARAACPTSPRPLCRDLAQSRLSIDAGSGSFRWKAARGPSTNKIDFGDPRASTSFSVCAWEASTLILAADVLAAASCDGASCWSDSGATGLRYRSDTTPVRSIDLLGSSSNRTRVRVSGTFATGAPLPVAGQVTVQLLRDDSAICFESAVPLASFTSNSAARASAKAAFDATTHVPVLPSSGCSLDPSPYAPGVSTADQLVHDGLTRTFRIYLPPNYDAAAATPVVFLMHGGFGSGAQIESSSHMLDVAAAGGFIVVSPDGYPGAGGVRAWNAGTCCGIAFDQNIDDVGFVAAILDQLESRLCVDARRVYATGMSNGASMSHRLGCDLGNRVRAIATVSGVDMTASCNPVRPLAELTIHGTDDPHAPYDGSNGCGPTGDIYHPSVPVTLARWRERDDCSDTPTSATPDGDAICTAYEKCAPGDEVEACIIDGGGHQWPGGEPPAISGIGNCPFGYQSETFPASQRIWEFFSAHPVR
ncbi:MAG TPA: PHB depolymerase family esterase [Candidatus Binatia bacterium]